MAAQRDSKQFNIHEAKTHFSRLVERSQDGEEIVIGRAGKPVAKLVPFTSNKGPRKPGSWRGKVKISDDFDELPANVKKAFRGLAP